MNYVDEAKQLATRAHAGQFRRDGVTPYITHPAAVAESVEDDEAKALAWLHDVIEDTNTSWKAVAATGLPSQVLDALKLLTKTSSMEYQSYIIAISKNDLARRVKIADINHNLSCSPSSKQIKKYRHALEMLQVD